MSRTRRTVCIPKRRGTAGYRRPRCHQNRVNWERTVEEIQDLGLPVRNRYKNQLSSQPDVYDDIEITSLREGFVVPYEFHKDSYHESVKVGEIWEVFTDRESLTLARIPHFRNLSEYSILHLLNGRKLPIWKVDNYNRVIYCYEENYVNPHCKLWKN